ncbi:VOC family protein [Planotetraspora mira]|uniref:Hydrolase n=1 Tax=Planotetraspora mira TaxID=58121 RepID=A0A8J3TUV1_9ACTN|nr:VOC family protein [Planotetraspora mira]GII32908.1 hydrolase [Planotetraspora mira]
MDVDHYEDGVPSWAELTTPEPAASAAFYGRLFGWHYTDGLSGKGSDRTAVLRARPVAAFTENAGAERATWTTYVNVADADETAARVTAAGGGVLKAPADVSAAGRSALLSDHSGARFAVWQPGRHRGAGVVNEPGTFSWGELITDDVEASADFYGLVFGWTATAPEGTLGRREWRLNDRPVSGLLPRPPAMPAEIPPYWDVYFTVADAAATADTVTRLGGTVLMGVTPVAHGVIAVFTDPAGAVFTVLASGR